MIRKYRLAIWALWAKKRKPKAVAKTVLMRTPTGYVLVRRPLKKAPDVKARERRMYRSTMRFLPLYGE